MVYILPLGSGSGDPHISEDPDPGSQNLADLTNPDSKHCVKLNYFLTPYVCMCSLCRNVFFPFNMYQN